MTDIASTSAPVTFRYPSFINGMLWIFVSLGSFTFIEPAPYDILSLIIMPIWFVGGFAVHRSIIPLVTFLLMNMIGGFFALIPYFGVTDSQTHWFYTVYLSISAIFFAMMFGEDALKRSDICIRAYLVSCVLAAVLGVIGWFDIGGTAQYFSPLMRATGPFKDPNVFGSYLIAGYLFLLQRLLGGEAKTVAGRFLTLATILLLTLGVFLSFSRGSWGAMALATILMSAFMYYTSDDKRARRRLVIIFSVVIAVVIAGILVALSIESIREVFTMRASLNQEYDVGETGRFGNQLRSLPMLLDRPNGMGPLRFRLFFGLEPHNSYIANFADNGWLGGFAYLLLVGTSCFVGFRLSSRPSPYRANGQIYFIALLMFFIQAVQIDIDHWRFVYLLLGMVWGLEAARQRWLAEGGEFGDMDNTRALAHGA